MPKPYIGTSGWNYKHWWNGVFYPKDLAPSKWLQFFTKHFDTVEINNSFYRLPSEAIFEKWREQVPSRFIFAVKASRFITHIKRLKDSKEPLDLFFLRARHLQHRLGPILFQLPPGFTVNMERLDDFLRNLKSHGSGTKVKCVLEVRDASWLTPDVFDLLRRYRTALCFADWRDTHVTEPVTTNFVYVRRHSGSAGRGNYSKAELNRDVRQIRKWLANGLDVYVYFNNDLHGFAIQSAKYVRENCGT